MVVVSVKKESEQLRILSFVSIPKAPCLVTRALSMVIIKNSCKVKPNEPTPNLKLWLSECDQLRPPAPHCTFFFVYPPQPNHSVSSPFETLKTSLSRVLVPYFPFAGRLNRIERDRFEVHCTAMGAELIEAESEDQIEDLGDFRPTQKTRMLAPCIDYTNNLSEWPLLAVQVTRFKCGGISIGFAYCHMLADGKGMSQFMASWANIALGEQEIVEPFHDRTVFYQGNPCAKPRFDHVELKTPPTLIENTDKKEEQMKKITTTMLKLSKNQVDRVKKMANEVTTKDKSSCDYTRYESLAGYIWKCTSKARRLQNKQLTSLRMTVNCSNRFQPALPSGYYGNTIIQPITIAEAGELLSDPSGLGYACSRISSCLRGINSEYIESAINFLSAQQDLSSFRKGDHIQRLFHSNPNLGITSWIGGPIYEVDFGWGRPNFCGPAELDFDGKAYVIPGKDDDGSLLVAMSLQVAHMYDFERFFYEGIGSK